MLLETRWTATITRRDGETQRPVRMMVGQDVVRDLVFAVLAKDLVAFREFSFLQRGGGGHHLEDRSRLINVTERPVGAALRAAGGIMFKVIRRLVG